MHSSIASVLARFRRAVGQRVGHPGRRHPWHSVSSTREYEKCPRRYRFAYVDKRPEDRPVPRSWRFGSAVHEGLEAGYRHAVENPDAPVSARMQAAADAIDRTRQRLELGDAPSERDRAVWHATRALAQDVLDVDEILGVELAMRDELDGDDRIVGFADLVLARPDGVVEIVDHKVTNWRATPDKLQEDFQLNLYGYLARLRWPWVTAVVATHHYPTGPEAVSTRLTHGGMQVARERVESAAAAIAADRTFAPTPSQRCRHCPWQPSCPEGTTYLEDFDGPGGSAAEAASPDVRSRAVATTNSRGSNGGSS